MARRTNINSNNILRGDGPFNLSREQMSAMLRNLESSASVLKEYLTEEEPSNKYSRKCHCKGLPQWTTNNLFIITLVLQALNVLLLTIMDEWPSKAGQEYIALIASTAVMIVLQLTNLLLLLLTSARLTKQVFQSKVSNWFLAQSYLAAILVFAGIYTCTYRLDRNSWRALAENLYEDPILVVELYCRMMFLSVSTATLCGSANVTPKEWYNYLLMSAQMLLSFCYFAQILAQTTGFQQPFLASLQDSDSPGSSFIHKPSFNVHTSVANIQGNYPNEFLRAAGTSSQEPVPSGSRRTNHDDYVEVSVPDDVSTAPRTSTRF